MAFKTIIHGTAYDMATTLRVAYVLQKQHNRKPYNQIFSELGDMTIEDQIGVLYASFSLANPSSGITQTEFVDYYLDHYNLTDIMGQLETLISEVTGMGIQKDEASKANRTGKGKNQGN